MGRLWSDLMHIIYVASLMIIFIVVLPAIVYGCDYGCYEPDPYAWDSHEFNRRLKDTNKENAERARERSEYIQYENYLRNHEDHHKDYHKDRRK